MMVNGKWTGRYQPVQGVDEQGGFVRERSQFRHWVGEDEAFPLASGRYHLYVAMICPWACRTLMVRGLLGLEDVISVSRVKPALSEQGWAFGDTPPFIDPYLGARHLHQLYSHSDAAYTGRATVPVLWDKERRCIVNNESADIVRVLNGVFRPLGTEKFDLYPEFLRGEIDCLNERYYHTLNNGVYRAGFATTQVAYEEAYRDVFEALDELEARLSTQPYVLGEQVTETDVRLFVTLVRFDLAYYSLFKCNLRRIADYPALSAYLRRLYALPGVADTVEPEAIKAGYYSIESLNPTGIVPLGPETLPFLG
ncbi:glutathione S-transferase family protein [Motiliproteus sp. SC1-56]|uniref:glutathione S-transferase family protein n=1 Tax=Motiliproteus sp. SC1-56 TaxID=2799565 RepID=UPI001A8DF815|nr:glutathione S-transferase C-terminal domain-containing protein [Motiliproteus sp. SC1-56]